MRPDTGLLRSLTSTDVKEVIRDMRLAQSGAVLHYCTDPHELYDYCFPVKPNELTRHDAAEISDEQLALDDIFFEMPNRPLLLQEYDEEMARLSAAVLRIVGRAYGQAELLETLESPFHLLDVIGAATRNGKVLPAVEEMMNAIFTVALGLISIGVTRFDEICNRRLQSLGQLSDEKLLMLVGSYARSDLVGYMLTTLKSSVKNVNLVADVGAVDRLISLNCALTQMYERRELGERHIFLYLSSAERSRQIFSLPGVRKALPVIEGERYSILRTRAQVFAGIVTRRWDASGQVDFEEGLRQLELMHSLISEIEEIRLSDQCATCLLEGGIGHRCSRAERCGGLLDVADRIRERRQVMANLALARALERYKRISRISEDSPIERRAIYAGFLRRVRSSDMQTLALQRIKDVYLVIKQKSQFASRLVRSLSEARVLAFLRAGRDPVSAASQYLPTLVNVGPGKYADLVSKIVAFYRHPTHTLPTEDLALIESASDEYLQLDGQLKEFDPTHELVRCLLYMALPLQDGDEAAFAHGIEMLKRFPTVDREFLYVIAWAGRRSKQYQKTADWIDEALRRYPDDLRFWHGLALNIYSWLVDETAEVDCPYVPRQAIEATERTIAMLARADPPHPFAQEIRAANYNNLAYFRVQWPDEDGYDVVAAREALDSLKIILPRPRWELFPEYFHTEALVEYREALALRAKNEEPSEIRAKLNVAQREIRRALLLVPDKETYQRLRDTIAAELRVTP